jgi:hypothetical protein
MFEMLPIACLIFVQYILNYWIFLYYNQTFWYPKNVLN